MQLINKSVEVIQHNKILFRIHIPCKRIKLLLDIVSRQAVNSIELGKFIPSTVLALKMSKVFKTPVEEIFQLEKMIKDSANPGGMIPT